jgi:aryl-alcohol dehydrogenase-like predicted oxidoreductase
LSKSLEGTLRRLGRERVEVFLLHSPAIDVVLAGEAIGALDRAREEGKVGWIGVSVDEPGTAAAALADERVQVLEIPLHPGTTNFLGIVHDAHERGVAIVAREILGGKTALASTADPAAFASARISEVVDDASITLPLVGATRIQTVIASAEAARRDADNGSGLR